MMWYIITLSTASWGVSFLSASPTLLWNMWMRRPYSSCKVPVQFYHRFVDDIFINLGKQYVGPFHNALNSIHPTIKFPKVEESNNFLSFLDVHVSWMPTGQIDRSLSLASNREQKLEERDIVLSSLRKCCATLEALEIKMFNKPENRIFPLPSPSLKRHVCSFAVRGLSEKILWI